MVVRIGRPFTRTHFPICTYRAHSLEYSCCCLYSLLTGRHIYVHIILPSPSCDNPNIFFHLFCWPFFYGESRFLLGECWTDRWCPAICYLMAKFDTDNLALLGVVTRHMWVRVCVCELSPSSAGRGSPPLLIPFSGSLFHTQSQQRTEAEAQNRTLCSDCMRLIATEIAVTFHRIMNSL